jgi:hypothetical protein
MLSLQKLDVSRSLQTSSHFAQDSMVSQKFSTSMSFLKFVVCISVAHTYPRDE